MLPFQKILCPTDYSEPAQLALQNASELAAHFGAKLCVLHVVAPIPNELGVEAYTGFGVTDADHEALEAAQKQLCDMLATQLPSQVRSYALTRLGHAADEIERAARVENADLIVIATHGVSGWRHLVFGSVTEKVMRQVRIPLLVVHQPPEHQKVADGN
jgi:nucleotide-binding universal stress UspA family protein